MMHGLRFDGSSELRLGSDAQQREALAGKAPECIRPAQGGGQGEAWQQG